MVRERTQEQVEPTRLLLFENGEALGVFPLRAQGAREDGNGAAQPLPLPWEKHSAVVMEPSGACFTHVRQDGSCHRQLSDFCRRDLVSQVAAVANFRNAHSPRPYVSQRLHATTHGSTDERGTTTTRRSTRPSRLALWPTTAEAGPDQYRKHCTVHADGRVEVRAAGGNARLTLSPSRTVAEVDYAVAVPGDAGAVVTTFPVSEEENVRGERGSGAARDVAAATAGSGRAWVNRRFLVDSSSSSAAAAAAAVPTEFAHAIGVALQVSSFSVGAGGSAVCSEGFGSRGGHVEGGDGVVPCELPQPEARPDSARWNTVQVSPRVNISNSLAVPSSYHDRRDSEWLDAVAGTQASARIGPGLLSVDVMKLAEERGFAGSLAAVVEATGGCTYRVVVGGGVGGWDVDGGNGGAAESGGVNVHVVVHADGTEVLLDGDFVSLVHRSAPTRTRSRERLLHVAATSTVHFRVPSAWPCLEPLGTCTLRAARDDASVVGGADGNTPSHGWELVSLGDIASRALALRRQFVQCSLRPLPLGSALEQQDLARIIPPAFHSVGASAAPQAARVEATLCVASAAEASPAPTRTPWTATARRRGLFASTIPGQLSAPDANTTAAATTRCAFSATVVERAERDGASFVAFADGRARGIFSDRTIVTLGAQVSAPAPVEQHTARRGGAVGGVGRATSPVASGNWPVCAIAKREGEARHIECVLPDGSVVRGYYHPTPGKEIFGGGGVGGGYLMSLPHASVGDAGRSPAVGRNPGALGGSYGVRPLIFAVRRFAEWAFADPAERRASARWEVDGRLGAIAEAERNRRFITLQRLMKPTCTRTPENTTRQTKEHSRCGRSRSSAGSMPYSLEGRGASGNRQDGADKENMGFADEQRVRKGGSKAGRERNALVMRVLEANREAVIGREASRALATGRLMG